MMNDYDTLKDILEIAELLSLETDDTLEVLTYNETTGKAATVIYTFNDDGELVNIYTED